MEIGKKLRTFRANKGYTQENIADLLNIPQATYSNLENNKGKIDLNIIKKIATIYDMDILDMLKDEGTFYNQKNKDGNINQLSEKLIEQYEERITEMKEYIIELKQEISDLKIK